MKTIYTLIIVTLTLTLSANAQTAWTCNGSAIGTYNPNGNSYSDNTKIYNAEFDASGNVTYADKAGATTGIGLNAIGYRRQDNFVYGVRYTKSNGNVNELCRIDANGTITSLGAITGLKKDVQYFAGAFDNDGYLYASTGSGTTPYYLYKIDVVNKTAVSMGSIGSNRLVDMAFDPITNQLYATNSNATSDRGELLTIDLTANPITTTVKGAVDVFMFGLFFSGDAQLYGFGKKSDNTTAYYKINKSTGAITAAGKGPSASNADACSCPFRLTHTLSSAINPLAPGADTALNIAVTNLSGAVQFITYELTMDNRAQFSQTAAQIQSYIQSLFPGSTATVTISDADGGTKNKIFIEGIKMPITSSSVQPFKLNIRLLQVGFGSGTTIYMQSKIDAPGNTLNIGADFSDNPLTAQLDDATPLTIVTVQGAPLPVQLANLNGKLNAGTVALTWETKQEINTQKFEIERSTNGSVFTKIGETTAKGSAAVAANYAFNDVVLPSATTIYYRLKMVDADGMFRYTSVVVLRNNAMAGQITVYPSPFTDKFSVNATVAKATQMNMVLTDAHGRKVMIKSARCDQGSNTIAVTGLGNLAKGVYYLSIYDDAQLLENKQIIKIQ